MAKLLLMSIIFAYITLPARMAKQKNHRTGLRKTLIHIALFNLFYLVGILFIHARL